MYRYEDYRKIYLASLERGESNVLWPGRMAVPTFLSAFEFIYQTRLWRIPAEDGFVCRGREESILLPVKVGVRSVGVYRPTFLQQGMKSGLKFDHRTLLLSQWNKSRSKEFALDLIC